MVQTKLFLNLYLIKFLDTLVKSFFLSIKKKKKFERIEQNKN